MGSIFSGSAQINYLCLLPLNDDLAARIEQSTPGVEVRRISEAAAAELGTAEWSDVDVLHTSTVVPDPRVATRLRWVQLDTSGVDHLRHQPIWGSDIPITTIGGISPVPLAEYVIWAVLGVAHRLPRLLEFRERHRWPSPTQRWQQLMPAAVRGATVGIVGYGRIGREIGRLAECLGMHVLGLSRSGGQARRIDQYRGPTTRPEPGPADQGQGVQLLGPDDLPELMARSDFVVIVVPLTDETVGLIDASVLASAKPGAVLINVARGGIVDETALRRELRTGRLAAAVLDVFDDEPLAPDDPWWDEPGVFVTPHVSGLAPAYEAGVLDIVCENLRRFRYGEPLMNLVDRARGY